jgi:DNA-binding NarL/FixJ family response regulator
MQSICIADDHPLYRDALKDVLRQHFSELTVLEAGSLPQVQTLAQSHPELDFILLDLNMPGMQGLNGLLQLRQQYPQIAVAMLSAEDDQHTILQAMAFGAVGYISKSASRQQLVAAIRQLLNGDIYLPADTFRQPSKSVSLQAENGPPATSQVVLGGLTKKQLKVLQRMVTGETNKQIADALCIAETTVKAHVSAVLGKLGVSSRVQAILAARDIDFSRYS